MTDEQMPRLEGEESPDWFTWATARNLNGVVSIAQKDRNDKATVALSMLELYGGGYGLLRYLLSYEGLSGNGYEGSPDPETLVRAASGHPLEVRLVSFHAIKGEAQGLLEVAGLPESGEIEVEIVRLNFEKFGGTQISVVRDPLEGPWNFRFSL